MHDLHIIVCQPFFRAPTIMKESLAQLACFKTLSAITDYELLRERYSNPLV